MDTNEQGGTFPRRPTDAELELLQVLWQRGPLTVREVLEDLPPARRVGYTTVLKILQNMTQKGLVVRDEEQRSHVYHVAHSEERTQTQLVRDLLERAFDGSAEKLVLRALSSGDASREDLDEIQRILDDMKNRKHA